MPKRVPPLTEIQIRNAKPAEKTLYFFDGGGLFLMVEPSGVKSWRMKYRFDGKAHLLSMGPYPAVSLKDAREKRENAKRLLASGVDLSENRKAVKTAGATKSANSFEVIAREYLAKIGDSMSPGNIARIQTRLVNDIYPWLGARPIADITSPEFLKVIRRLESRTVYTAHRAMRECSRVFRYAISTGRATNDPTQALRGALAPVREGHFTAVTDPAAVSGLMRAIWGYSGHFVVSCALRLAPMFFVRPGELRHAKWADINFETAEWRFTASKTKTEHIVPLARQAIAILRELQPLTGNGEYVFPGGRTPTRPMSENGILAALRRMGIGKEEMTGHGFRAMARTILDEVLGFRPDFIEHQLAHAVRDPNGRAYNRTAHLDQRREMMQRWADYLDELRTGETGTMVTATSTATA
ncbi:MAG: integrase arm-type DNA-binding domain-containing protein [Candidatus Riflebacteria bacterium]|nr:integrase arm-type DNA-binding domain-containing protein [Candidatus Riflebacteria bacterium]